MFPAAFLLDPQGPSLADFSLKGGEQLMKFHLFFLTISIQRRIWTAEEIEQEQLIRQVEEEMMDRKCSMYRLF